MPWTSSGYWSEAVVLATTRRTKRVPDPNVLTGDRECCDQELSPQERWQWSRQSCLRSSPAARRPVPPTRRNPAGELGQGLFGRVGCRGFRLQGPRATLLGALPLSIERGGGPERGPGANLPRRGHGLYCA